MAMLKRKKALTFIVQHGALAVVLGLCWLAAPPAQAQDRQGRAFFDQQPERPYAVRQLEGAYRVFVEGIERAPTLNAFGWITLGDTSPFTTQRSPDDQISWVTAHRHDPDEWRAQMYFDPPSWHHGGHQWDGRARLASPGLEIRWDAPNVRGPRAESRLRLDDEGLSGPWRNSDEETGGETWRKVTPRPRQIIAVRNIRHLPQHLSETTADIVEGTTQDPPTLVIPYQPEVYRLRGNRQRISIRVTGENMWAPFYPWIPYSSGLELDDARYACRMRDDGTILRTINPLRCLAEGNPVLGYEVTLTVWQWAEPGEQTLWLGEGRPVRFYLDIDGWPEDQIEEESPTQEEEAASSLTPCPETLEAEREAVSPITCLCERNGAEQSVRRVWGTDIYSDDSHVCTAAIHAGVVDPQGRGEVIVHLRPGQSRYEGSTRNGVQTAAYDSPWPGSFAFEPCASVSAGGEMAISLLDGSGAESPSAVFDHPHRIRVSLPWRPADPADVHLRLSSARIPNTVRLSSTDDACIFESELFVLEAIE